MSEAVCEICGNEDETTFLSEEQYEAYSSVVAQLKGAPVTIRTLDIGADKPLEGGRYGTGRRHPR